MGVYHANWFFTTSDISGLGLSVSHRWLVTEQFSALSMMELWKIRLATDDTPCSFTAFISLPPLPALPLFFFYFFFPYFAFFHSTGKVLPRSSNCRSKNQCTYISKRLWVHSVGIKQLNSYAAFQAIMGEWSITLQTRKLFNSCLESAAW